MIRARIWPVVAIAFFLLVSVACQTALAAEPKRVLLLYYSFGANFVNAKSIRNELDQQSRELLEIYDAPMMTVLPVNEGAVGRYADYLAALFPDQKLDLAVTVGGAAVRFFGRHRQQLFPSARMLAIAEARRIPTSDLAANDVVLSSTIDLPAVFDNILQVLPQTNNIAVVIGNSGVEQAWLEETRNAFKPFEHRASLMAFNSLSFDDMLNRAAALPPRSAILFLLLLTDAAGATHEDTKVFARLRQVANAPIFTYYDGYFGNGIVGGPLIAVQNRSEAAANVALRMLRGEAAPDITVAPIGFATPKFDWRELQRWGISEARLPAGSGIYFRNPSAWDQYRPQILAICAAVLLQAALIGWLLYEHRRRHAAEILVRNSMSELTQMNRAATAGELSASIAHEVSQPITGITTRAGAALRWLEAEKPDVDKARTALSEIVKAGHRASDIVTNVRAMFSKDSSDKAPVDLNKVIRAVLGLVYIDLRKHEIELETQLRDRLPPVFGNPVQLQQVVLNLIVNAIESMHTVPHRALRIQSGVCKPGVVRVAIEDSGTGIDPSNLDRIFKPLFTTKARGMGMGLSICASIIQSHDGRIWASPGPDGGSIFQFDLPAHADKTPRQMAALESSSRKA